jgi:hypothetical protein
MMDALTAFGLFAVTSMLVCYAFESYSHWWVLGFRLRLRIGLDLRLPARGLAVRRHRGDLGGDRLSALATTSSPDQKSRHQITQPRMSGSP